MQMPIYMKHREPLFHLISIIFFFIEKDDSHEFGSVWILSLTFQNLDFTS